MSVWLSEKEFRQSGAESLGVTINVAFLQEIKDDFGFRAVLNEAYYQLKPKDPLAKTSPRVAAELLNSLRDELETYFALEEFYGYFKQSAIANPCVNQQAIKLQSEHETLYLAMSELVEMCEQIVYRENNVELTLNDVADKFENFCIALARHEQSEMDLMMRLCNEDIGVGD